MEGNHDTVRNEPELSNAFPIPVVVKLIKKKNEVYVGSVPTEGHHDARSSLNERNGIEEECLGDVHGTTSQGSSQDDVTTEGTGISPIQLWGSNATGDEDPTPEVKGKKTEKRPRETEMK